MWPDVATGEQTITTSPATYFHVILAILETSFLILIKVLGIGREFSETHFP